MGKLTEAWISFSPVAESSQAWSQCESVVLTGAVEIAGTYHRSGFSIYQASEEETALLYGKTYGVSYFNEPMGLRLLYTDAGKWEIVREDPGKEAWKDLERPRRWLSRC